jgi:hypothetical protein
MAQPGNLNQWKRAPLASIGDAFASFQRAAPWPQLRLPWSGQDAGNPTCSFAAIPPAALASHPISGSQPTELLVPMDSNSGVAGEFQLPGGNRHGSNSIHPPTTFVRQLHNRARQQHEPGHAARQALMVVLNRHLVPGLVAMAAAQQHVAQSMLRFLRARGRGGGAAGAGMDDSDGSGGSAILQTNGPRPANRTAQRLYDAARTAERGLDPLSAADKFLAAVEADPRQAEWLSLAAKNYSDSMYLPGMAVPVAQHYNQRAIDLASRALAIDPTAAHGYIARCVSRGRLALLCDNRTKVGSRLHSLRELPACVRVRDTCC